MCTYVSSKTGKIETEQFRRIKVLKKHQKNVCLITPIIHAARRAERRREGVGPAEKAKEKQESQLLCPGEGQGGGEEVRYVGDVVVVRKHVLINY